MNPLPLAWRHLWITNVNLHKLFTIILQKKFPHYVDFRHFNSEICSTSDYVKEIETSFSFVGKEKKECKQEGCIIGAPETPQSCQAYIRSQSSTPENFLIDFSVLSIYHFNQLMHLNYLNSTNYSFKSSFCWKAT